MVEKMLISLPQHLAVQLRVMVPARQRSALIARLLEKELQKQENALRKSARMVEADEALNAEMKEWEELTRSDGLDDESW